MLPLHAEVLHGAVDHRGRQIVDGTRVRVERRRGGQNNGSRFGQGGHVAQMDERIGRFAHHAHQRTPLLEHHVGGALDERQRHARGDASHAAHRGGYYYHGVESGRAARRGREHVGVIVTHDLGRGGQPLALVLQNLGGAVAHDERDALDLRRLAKYLQTSAGVYRSARARYGCNDFHGLIFISN